MGGSPFLQPATWICGYHGDTGGAEGVGLRAGRVLARICLTNQPKSGVGVWFQSEISAGRRAAFLHVFFREVPQLSGKKTDPLDMKLKPETEKILERLAQ